MTNSRHLSLLDTSCRPPKALLTIPIHQYLDSQASGCPSYLAFYLTASPKSNQNPLVSYLFFFVGDQSIDFTESLAGAHYNPRSTGTSGVIGGHVEIWDVKIIAQELCKRFLCFGQIMLLREER